MHLAILLTIGAFVAPHAAVREKARQVIGKDRFLEVYCTAPMNVLRERDKSGAYKLADEGKIARMPGVTAAFEEPLPRRAAMMMPAAAAAMPVST